MEGDVIESIAARIRFATGCSYSTSVEAAAISVNLLKPSHDESKNRIADLEAKLATAEAALAEIVRERNDYRSSFAKSRDDELSAAQEIAVELRDGTCEWWEDGEMWESSCGVAYTFIDTDGPADNGHTFCHKCGKRIAIDEARGSMIVR